MKTNNMEQKYTKQEHNRNNKGPGNSTVLQACESHDHDHQCTDYAMVWLPQGKRKRENKVARLVWDFDCLHFAQYILISPYGIDCKQTWCKKIYRMDRVSWLKPLGDPL